MGKSDFVAKIRRALGVLFGWLKELSPKKMSKRCFAYFGNLSWWETILWSILGCTTFLFFLAFTTTTFTAGSSSAQVVPYSKLVDHLQSKTVTTALFEEESQILYFNLRPMEEVNRRDVAETILAIQNEKELIARLEPIQEGLMNMATERTGDGSRVSLTSSEFSAPNELISQTKMLAPSWAYSTRRVQNDEAFLLQLMRDAGVKYSSGVKSRSTIELIGILMAPFSSIIRLCFILSPAIWLMRKNILGMGRFRTRRGDESQKVKFEDVAGVDIAKAELMEIVDCMKAPAKFASLGAKLPRGVLLVGPPGTGKTLLARAVAHEAGVPFYAAAASEFVEMFVGRGAARIRDLFSMARKNTPCIVFIDELDAVGGERGSSHNDERDQTLNQLLTEMDGFESDSGVLVLAATNRVGALDPALCRPGRLSRKVHVTAPNLKGRQEILAVHIRGKPLEEDPLLLQRLASMTDGLVGADLANLVNEAASLAARKGRSAVTFEDFKAALDRVRYGINGDKSREVYHSWYI